jgi:hypothetical protein
VSLLFPERVVVRLAPAAGGMNALRDAPFKRGSRVTVILSNHYVRYAVVPWSDALSGEAEEQAYLRPHFARIHGERAKGWVFRWSHGIASAIDKELLDEIRLCFASKRTARLVSVQPELMAAFNRARASLPAEGAWLVLAEPDRACVALHAGGRWLSVQNARGAWEALLERERYRAGPDCPQAVLQLAGHG